MVSIHSHSLIYIDRKARMMPSILLNYLFRNMYEEEIKSTTYDTVGNKKCVRYGEWWNGM